MTGFWKLAEQFRGSRRVTLDGGRKTGVEDRGSSTRGKDGGCNLEDGDGIFPPRAAVINCLLACCIYESSYNPRLREEGRPASADSLRRTGGGKNGCIVSFFCPSVCRRSFKTPVFVLLSQVETCSLDLLVNSDFSVEDKRGKYRKELKGCSREGDKAKDRRRAI